MDGRKLREYYLSFYAPKFLIPISCSRLSVVMSHFLISARSDYYAIEPLYKTLISRYMSCGGELATRRWQHCFSLHLPHSSPLVLRPEARTNPTQPVLGIPILRWTIVYGNSLFIAPVVTDFSSAGSIVLYLCFNHLRTSNIAFYIANN